MASLETYSGIALLIAAVGALSPFWVPPIRRTCLNAAHNASSTTRKALNSIPARRSQFSKGVEACEPSILKGFVLYYIGMGTVLWFELAWDGGWTRISIILAGTGAFAAVYACFVIAPILQFLWRCFWWLPDEQAAITILNPLHRVGVAEPLGEARFARMEEVARALMGSKSPRNPKFKD